MTAYGHASLATLSGHYRVEIFSVNRKYLEINLALPFELSSFEADIKKWIGSTVQRGYLTIRIVASFEKMTPLAIRPNLARARQLKQAWDEIAKELGLAEDGFQLSMLADDKDIMLYEQNVQGLDALQDDLKQTIDSALSALLAMKKNEGEQLEQDIHQRITLMQQSIKEITTLSPDAVQKFQLKLKKHIEEVVPGCLDNEDRILREVAIYAEKIDISEEITRFSSHLKQFDEILYTSEISKGKKLEFLVQELNREINTIGSKAPDIAVMRHVLSVKGELEKMREQLQNVE